jgi:Flp pilus assembly pilin Flp
MHGQSARAKSNRKESTFMMDRFNVWVGSLYARSQSFSLKKDEGQTFVEYALVLSVIVVGVLLLATWAGLGTAISAAITKITNAINPPAAPSGGG